MSPGRLGLHSTGCGLPVVESSNTSDGKCVRRRLLAAGGERHGPVDREACVVVLRGHGVELERRVLGHVLLPEAARARCRRRWPAPGWCGRSSLNSGSAPTSDGPKSDTMTSIFGYLAMSAERTFCVSAGSQFVTSNGCSPMNLYLCVGSRILWRPWFSSMPWLLPFGPLSMSTLPPFGSTWRIHLPQFSPPGRRGCR